MRSALNMIAIFGLSTGVGFCFVAMKHWWTRVVPFFAQRGDYLPAILGAAPWIGLVALTVIFFLDYRESK